MDDLQARLGLALRDQLEIIEPARTGGMAKVYAARDTRHGREVALKVLPPEVALALGTDRFLQEIRVTARLQHPGILPLLDSGEADGLLYYTSPFIRGESLRERIDRETHLPIEDAVQIALEVAAALSFAHGQGVVHRDIKPSNILMNEGRPVLADFGVASAIEAAGGERLTATGLTMGSPMYMAPEQIDSARVDGRADVYSLGCVLYEMLVGNPPFTGSNAAAILARHLADTVPRPSVVRKTIPEALESSILRALAKVPADRFATAERFAEALSRGADAPRPTAVPSVTSSRSRIRRSLPIARLAGTVGVLAAIFLVLGLAPDLQALFASQGSAMSLPTRVLVGLSQLGGQYWWVIVAAAVFVMVRQTRDHWRKLEDDHDPT